MEAPEDCAPGRALAVLYHCRWGEYFGATTAEQCTAPETVRYVWLVACGLHHPVYSVAVCRERIGLRVGITRLVAELDLFAFQL